MTAKELYQEIENLFKTNKDYYITFEELMDIFPKQPTASNAKKILTLMKRYNVKLITSACRSRWTT